jgi:uncharacterized protein (TIGR02246 family)
VIAEALERFVAAFNANELDRVMSFFAPDAVYAPGDGRVHRGVDAIRAAFEPQFRGVFGAMRFDLQDRLVDEPGRKAAIRWICRHDVGGAHARRVPLPQRWVYRLLYGRRFGWLGVDVFRFDEQGRIAEKHTYANYGRPQIRRELGAV